MCERQIPRPPRPQQPRSAASVALESWLTSTGKLQASLVRRLDISRARLSSYVRGIRVPKIRLAIRLERLTGGAVKVMDWRKPAGERDKHGRRLRRG